MENQEVTTARLQKPFLTVETGEAYQPIRLTYTLKNKDELINIFESLQCLQKNPTSQVWTWYWKDECDDLHFESIPDFRKNPDHPLRIGTFALRDDKLFLNLPSFKRACLAVTFFHRQISPEIITIHHADFINKVFGIDERLPHGFSELYKEEELERALQERNADYEKIKDECEHAATAEEAFQILSDFAHKEETKRLPYAERYAFSHLDQDPDIIFLGFYVYLRGRELVAIKRWFGQTGYTLEDAIDEITEKVFGEMGIDIIE